MISPDTTWTVMAEHLWRQTMSYHATKSALGKRIEREIDKGNLTDINTTDDEERVLATRYGFRVDHATRHGQDKQVWTPCLYGSLAVVEKTLNTTQPNFTADDWRMWRRVQSAIERWQEQGEKE